MTDTHTPHTVAWTAPELAIVIPTFKESANIVPLFEKLKAALDGVAWEAIYVDDDSPDGTAAAVQALSQTDPRARCIRRVGRRGLSSACVEGMLSTSARYVAVIDADLQHDEAILPGMLALLRANEADLVVGTRYDSGGSVEGWASDRQKKSQLATLLSQRLLKVTLSDPMSGFFMMRRDAIEAAVYGLSNIGFKILLDLIVSSPKPLRISELPYHFRNRVAGESKLDNRVAWEYLMMLVDKTIGRWIPTRLVSFLLIGGSGVLVNLVALRALGTWIGMPFATAATGAVLISMASNYALNNALTYRDQQLRGLGFIVGMLKYMAACGIGAYAQVGVASYLYEGHKGWLASALAGVVVGTAWNYVATSYFVWARKGRA